MIANIVTIHYATGTILCVLGINSFNLHFNAMR